MLSNNLFITILLILVWLLFATIIYPLFVTKVVRRFFTNEEDVKKATAISHRLLKDVLDSLITNRMAPLLDDVAIMKATISENGNIDIEPIAERIRETTVGALNGWYGNKIKEAEAGMTEIQGAMVEQASTQVDPMQLIIAKIAQKDEATAAIIAALMQQQNTAPQQQRQTGRGGLW